MKAVGSFLSRYQIPTWLRHGKYSYLTIILLAIGFRHFIIEANDPYKCRALLSDGQWYHDRTWLTPGCVTEPYGSRSTTDCLAKRRVVFAGDHQMQALYWAMVQKLDHEVQPQITIGRSLHASKNEVDVEFFWDPYLNSTELHDAVGHYYHESNPGSPALLVLSIGNSHAEKTHSKDILATVEEIADAAGRPGRKAETRFRSLSPTDGPGDLLLFAPTQEPYHDEHAWQLPSTRINAHMRKLASKGTINYLESFSQMTDTRPDKFQDGADVHWDVLQQRVDVLLGLRCSAQAAERGYFPNTKTCCANWRRPNWSQNMFLVVSIALLPALILIDHLRPFLSIDRRSLIRALGAFCAVITLQHFSDRTHIFEQVRRLPLVDHNLMGMLIFTFLVGIATVRKSSPPKVRTQPGKENNHPFLPRDQSDEWKGWMQALIIIYHYNMAWTADWYWEIIRLAVASYLFLTGFGHTVYFLQKKDYSFRRFCAVMIRTNLLPSTLAYIMRTRWLLYYYMPLSTFWFLMVYITMSIGSKHNRYKLFVLAKIIASATLVHTVINTRDLPETVVRFFIITCKLSFDAREFFGHRVRIDQYITYVGMVIGLLYVWHHETKATEGQNGFLHKYYRRLFPWLKYTCIGVSLVVFPTFFYLVHTRIRSQAEWTVQQPYIAFIPILTFLILRNGHPWIRNYHSAAFAWLGRYSGEMYVMQNHLWLASDQEAVLRTGFFRGNETVLYDRWKDLALLSPTYLIACSIIGDATGSITTFFTKPAAAPNVHGTSLQSRSDEVEMALLSVESESDQDLTDEKLVRKRRPWQYIQWWPDDVRYRGLLMLGVMWFVNIVSSMDLIDATIHG